jgi:hypothetical protein
VDIRYRLLPSEWRGNLEKVDEPISWECFNCQKNVGGRTIGWRLVSESGKHRGWVAVCNVCNYPVFIDRDGQPAQRGLFGVSAIAAPALTRALYDEARFCHGTGAFSATTLLCRKLIMHIANDLADSDTFNKRTNFVEYIDWLEANNWAPPRSRPWIDHIRERGNAETHEIRIADETEARQLLIFVGALIAFAYELNAQLQPPTA